MVSQFESRWSPNHAVLVTAGVTKEVERRLSSLSSLNSLSSLSNLSSLNSLSSLSLSILAYLLAPVTFGARPARAPDVDAGGKGVPFIEF